MPDITADLTGFLRRIAPMQWNANYETALLAAADRIETLEAECDRLQEQVALSLAALLDGADRGALIRTPDGVKIVRQVRHLSLDSVGNGPFTMWRDVDGAR